VLQQTLEPIFGATGALFVQFFIVLIVVLVLMTLVIWLVRLLSGGRLGVGFNRQRAPRLGLVDALPIDQKRRLILVRRDQFEHLILIGGPTDVVVEQTIFRGVPLNARLRPEPIRMPGAAPATPPTPAAGLPAHTNPTSQPAGSSDRLAMLRERVRPVPAIDADDLPSLHPHDPVDDADGAMRQPLAPTFRQRGRLESGASTGPILAERAPAADRAATRDAVDPLYLSDEYPSPASTRSPDETLTADAMGEALREPVVRAGAAPADAGHTGSAGSSPSSSATHDKSAATDRVTNLEQEMARMLAEISGKTPV